MNKNSVQIHKLCLSSMFIALGWLMPFITGQIPEIGNMLCPMHIPVLIAGFILGKWYGAGIGFIIPLTRSLIFGMPILYPIAFGMMFELAAYGFFSGFFFHIFKKIKINDLCNIYLSLGIAMIFGRIIWGITRALCGLFPNTSFTWKAFMTGAFITAWPGILLQFFLIPSIILLLFRTRLLDNFIPLDLNKEDGTQN